MRRRRERADPIPRGAAGPAEPGPLGRGRQWHRGFCFGFCPCRRGGPSQRCPSPSATRAWNSASGAASPRTAGGARVPILPWGPALLSCSAARRRCAAVLPRLRARSVSSGPRAPPVPPLRRRGMLYGTARAGGAGSGALGRALGGCGCARFLFCMAFCVSISRCDCSWRVKPLLLSGLRSLAG